MSQLETLIQFTKRIENTLEKQFNAQGRGLHTKVGSIEFNLPVALVKKIRWVATLRNKLVHEEDFKLENINQVILECESILSELEALSKERAELSKLFLGNSSYQKNGDNTGQDARDQTPRPVSDNTHKVDKIKARHAQNPVSRSFMPTGVVVVSALLVLTLVAWKMDFSFPWLGFFHGTRLSTTIHADDDQKGEHDKVALAELYREIDRGVFGYISKNAKTWLDQQTLIKNSDGSYDVQVMLHWDIPSEPILEMLNKYFWTASKQDLTAEFVSVFSQDKRKYTAIEVFEKENSKSSQKTSLSQKMYEFLVKKKAYIKVSIGRHSERVAIAEQRKCVKNCKGMGGNAFVVYLSDKPLPDGDSNTSPVIKSLVVIKGVTQDDFRSVKAITTDIEIAN